MMLDEDIYKLLRKDRRLLVCALRGCVLTGLPIFFSFFCVTTVCLLFFERNFVCAGNCLFLLPDG